MLVFFYVDSFLNLYWIYYNIAFCFVCFAVVFGHEACGLSAPLLGIIPTSSTMEGQVLTTGLPGKSQHLYLCLDTKGSVFLPGESQEWGSLLGCSLWGLTESDMIEAT